VWKREEVFLKAAASIATPAKKRGGELMERCGEQKGKRRGFEV